MVPAVAAATFVGVEVDAGGRRDGLTTGAVVVSAGLEGTAGVLSTTTAGTETTSTARRVGGALAACVCTVVRGAPGVVVGRGPEETNSTGFSCCTCPVSGSM